MSLLSRLFGGGAKAQAESETYKEFSIFAEPIKEAGGHRIAARIEKEVAGQTRTHTLIRADVCNDAEQARDLSIQKAKMLIDEQGERLFD